MKEDAVIYRHNKRAYEKVCAAFETSNRTCVIQPTGTGKMYVAMQLMDAHPHNEILYLTSYSPILSALDTEMRKCGVSSVRLSAALYAGLDEVSCSKQYDYIIMDEFHRAGAEVWGAWVTKLLENNPNAKILGLSATPVRYLDNNRDMSDELFDGNVASSMTLAEAVGAGILKMPKYVCAVYSLAEELERYKERIGKMKADTNKTEALALLEKARRSLEQSVGLPELFANHMSPKDGRYIVFCRNYEHMESMEAECQEWFRNVNSEVTMYELRTTHSDLINEQTLSAFNADRSHELKLLFVVDMLNEGVHLKNVDGCIMLRPTESMNVFLQQLGRAISVGSKGKTIIFDIVNNSAQLDAFGSFKSDVERAAAESGSGVQLDDFEIHESFRSFWDIVSQIDLLLSNKSWEEWLCLAQAYFKKHGELAVSSRYKTVSGEALGTWMRTQREAYKNGKLSAERQARLEDIGMVWNALDAAWEEMFACAQAYFQEHGNLDVPRTVKNACGETLGVWIQRQREAYKNGKLSAERQARLEAIGIVWNAHDAAWEEMFACAQAYFQEHGNLDVPSTFKTVYGENLGFWIQHQRQVNKIGKLSAERQARLEAIGTVWEMRDTAWEKMFACARAYFQEHRNLDVPCTFKTACGEALGVWIQHQRQVNKIGKLSAERKKRLEGIGMVWNAHDAAWEEMFACAQDYNKEHGNLNVAKRFKIASGKGLGRWIEVQRRAYENGRLSAEKQRSLESIGVVWDVKDAAWERMYVYAKGFFNEHGHLAVPKCFKTRSDEDLGAWIINQRQRYKTGRFSAERKEKLEAIGMVWSPYDAAWEEMFACAQTYFQEHGNLDVPHKFKTACGENLGAWIYRQREAYISGKLSAERQGRLEAIGMVWSPHGASWEKMFACAQTYFQEHENLDVPQKFKTASGEGLGKWIQSQRQVNKIGKLSAERKERLEGIGMVWKLR